MRAIFIKQQEHPSDRFYLETDHDMIIHFHMRDFKVGEGIVTNIANAIEHSRRVIMLLTRSVLFEESISGFQ